MSTILAVTDANTLKNAALGLSGGALLVAIILLKVISNIVGKIISSVVLVAVALVGYSQRAEITDCVNKVKTESTANAATSVKCTFFGQDLDVELPSISK
jgi:predicted aspartyl protease